MKSFTTFILQFVLLLQANKFRSILSVHLACNHFETCADFHLNHVNFLNALSKRCEIDDIIDRSKSNGVAFTHLPKAGGTTVKAFLQRTIERKRFIHREHYPFLMTEALFDRTSNYTLITLFRKPIDRAFSLYFYIHERHDIPSSIYDKHVREFWEITMKSSLVEWVSLPITQSVLQENTLQYFVSSIENPSKMLQFSEKWSKVQKVKGFTVAPWLNISSSLYVSYLRFIPESFQCKDHINVALVLLQRYAVVGSFEKAAFFWSVLLRRLHISKAEYSLALSLHENHRVQKRNQNDIDLVTPKLEQILYCENILYSMVKKVLDADYSCVSTSASSDG